VLAGLLAVLTAVGIALAAAPVVTAPTITSQPANPSNQTSASFKYTDSQTGVSFRCALDAAEFSACAASGITYPGPLAEGSHTFKVQAVAGTKTSSTTSYKWTIDTTPPTIALAFPISGHDYGETGWSTGCSGSPGLCGSAKDTSGVKSAVISIQQGSGHWWGGSSFNQTSEYFNATTLASPGASSTAWTYPMSLPPNASYTVHVRATDQLGNTTPAGSQVAATFTVERAPPTPVITSGPGEQTTATTATFTFTDSQEGVSLLCRLDGGSFSRCTSPKSYTGLSQGTHIFYVEAKVGSGEVSVASYTWMVETGKAFTISGSVSGPLAPGVSRPLPLTIANPNHVQISVTSLLASVQVGSTKAGCDGPTNLQVTQSNVSSKNTLTVPANGQITLPSGTVSAPQVLMNNLASNQDACKGASFTFNYTGSAHS
jgi:hypothetical protein